MRLPRITVPCALGALVLIAAVSARIGYRWQQRAEECGVTTCPSWEWSR